MFVLYQENLYVYPVRPLFLILQGQRGLTIPLTSCIIAPDVLYETRYEVGISVADEIIRVGRAAEEEAAMSA
jgi:hypothetical protein